MGFNNRLYFNEDEIRLWLLIDNYEIYYEI